MSNTKLEIFIQNLEDTTTVLQQLTICIEAIEDALGDINSNASAIEDIQETITTIQTNIETITSNISDIENNITTNTNSISSLAETVNTNTNSIDSINEDIEEINTSLEDTTEKATDAYNRHLYSHFVKFTTNANDTTYRELYGNIISTSGTKITSFATLLEAIGNRTGILLYDNVGNSVSFISSVEDDKITFTSNFIMYYITSSTFVTYYCSVEQLI